MAPEIILYVGNEAAESPRRVGAPVKRVPTDQLRLGCPMSALSRAFGGLKLYNAVFHCSRATQARPQNYW
jgi:hypothetical protein